MLWEKIQTNFKEIDKDNSKELDFNEFQEFSNKMGIRDKEIINKIFISIDAD